MFKVSDGRSDFASSGPFPCVDHVDGMTTVPEKTDHSKLTVSNMMFVEIRMDCHIIMGYRFWFPAALLCKTRGSFESVFVFYKESNGGSDSTTPGPTLRQYDRLTS